MNLEPLNNKKDIKIINIIFSLYTGYFLSFFATITLYIYKNGLDIYYIDSIKYDKHESAPWLLIFLITIIFSLLIYASLSYLCQKKYIIIKVPLTAFTLIGLVLFLSGSCFGMLSLMTTTAIFKQNAHWWSLYVFLPSLAYLSSYLNKYLSYIMIIIAFSPIFIIFVGFKIL